MATFHNQRISSAHTHTQLQVNISTNTALSGVRATSIPAQVGFTLLELLIVISLLAVIAGVAIGTYDTGYKVGAQYDLAKHDMATLRKALLQFRRDSGSNDFPKHGEYECTDYYNSGNAALENQKMYFPTEAGSSSSDIIKWCQHPANFWMLFTDPFYDSATGISIKEWNADTRRGWNGPYLQRKNGYVDVRENINPDGSGALNTGDFVTDLWGIASPFVSSSDDFQWRPLPLPEPESYSEFGTPYFLFDLDDLTPSDPARVLSLGSDHKYGGEQGCESSLNTDGYPYDLTVCLLK